MPIVETEPLTKVHGKRDTIGGLEYAFPAGGVISGLAVRTSRR